MNYSGKKWNPIGEHFVVNISQEPQKTGIALLSSDPRQWRQKPDAYSGIVEEVGPRCESIEKGDRVLIERWTYKQFDLDDERLIAKEHQVLIYQKALKLKPGNADSNKNVYAVKYGPETPTLGVVVLQLSKTDMTKDKTASNLIVPDDVRRAAEKKRRIYMGKVLMSASKDAKVGELLWVEKRERYQYRTPDGRLIFINQKDSWGEWPIFMKAEFPTEEKTK